MLSRVGDSPASPSPEVSAIEAYRDEKHSLDKQRFDEDIKDIQSARTQREKYARWVFLLVAAWIGALFLILIAQGACPAWHPFSDKVLIALISSMTINLIGTLVIVLKYIFKSDPKA
ncbi:MAG TPA: hypothetical protein VGU46_08585 [Acidobacteriaceae bacterium]|nr:hypothetical protein [Acidobacteriaceae bacterium]